MARILAAQGRLAEAEAVLKELLERSPGDAELAAELGTLNEKMASPTAGEGMSREKRAALAARLGILLRKVAAARRFPRAYGRRSGSGGKEPMTGGGNGDFSRNEAATRSMRIRRLACLLDAIESRKRVERS
jgi:hypothetical protein